MKQGMIILLGAALLVSCGSPRPAVQGIADEYIAAWKEFRPSRAFAAGDRESAFRFESLDPEKIEAWIAVNEETRDRLRGLPGKLSADDRADINLLERQILTELETWREDRAHMSSPALYSGLISQALTHLLAREDLPPAERRRAVAVRLEGIRRLCGDGLSLLGDGRPQSTSRSIGGLESSARFFENMLPGIVAAWPGDHPEDFEGAARETAAAVRELAAHVRDHVLPRASLPDALGRDVYASKLKIAVGLDLTPEGLDEIAGREIAEVRRLMSVESRLYHAEKHPDEPVPGSFDELVGSAIRDMEDNRESTQAGFLAEFLDLIERSEAFVRKQGIATIPEPRTLMTALSPAHFAGAAVGGVYPAGPFNPDADTLFYLPTVPDNAPEDVKEGFYRSFNNHFNAMIIPHEITPGHYMQAKIAAKLPRIVRPLFPDGLYVEGWATLCEPIALDAGWNGRNRLDRLAHLRKKLENAVRAYISVQVHCNDWDRDRVLEFAVKEGLLAPQFAVNLWDRVIDSPFQITTYFLGLREMSDFMSRERAMLGAEFDLRAFCDAVLGAGPVPISFLPELVGTK